MNDQLSDGHGPLLILVISLIVVLYGGAYYIIFGSMDSNAKKLKKIK